MRKLTKSISVILVLIVGTGIILFSYDLYTRSGRQLTIFGSAIIALGLKEKEMSEAHLGNGIIAASDYFIDVRAENISRKLMTKTIRATNKD